MSLPCNAVTHLGPAFAPLLCGLDDNHPGPHAWQQLPCLTHATVQLGTIEVPLAALADACNRPPCPVQQDETHA